MIYAPQYSCMRTCVHGRLLWALVGVAKHRAATPKAVLKPHASPGAVSPELLLKSSLFFSVGNSFQGVTAMLKSLQSFAFCVEEAQDVETSVLGAATPSQSFFEGYLQSLYESCFY